MQVSEPAESPDRLLKTTISADQLRMAAEAESISMTIKPPGIITATLPGLAKVSAALRNCEEALAKSWGKPITWATPAIERSDIRGLMRNDDYPSQAITKGAEGAASVLIKVDETGKPAGCFAHEIEGNRVFAAVVCTVVSERGRFEPARDSSGRAVGSYYLTPLIRFALE